MTLVGGNGLGLSSSHANTELELSGWVSGSSAAKMLFSLLVECVIRHRTSVQGEQDFEVGTF